MIAKGFMERDGTLLVKQLGGIKLLLNSNYNDEILLSINEKKIPIFYGEILYAWMSVRSRANTKCKTVLWHNQNFTYNKRSFYYGYWYESGIVYLKDIIENNCLMTMNIIACKLLPHKRKSNLMFDYVKFKKALPKTWINQSENNSTQISTDSHNQELQIPSIFIRKKRESYF